MKEMKRVLALLLCLVMVVGILPAGALNAWAEEVEQAAEQPVVVIAGSDFQNKSGDEAGANTVTSILTQIQKDYPTANGFLFAGDYDQDTHNSQTETEKGIKYLTEAVTAKYGALDTVLVQGNHDYASTMLSKTGAHDSEAYGVYILDEDDYPDGAGFSSSIQTLANNLGTYLDGRLETDPTEPVFVVSHVPLHYSYRTRNNGNGVYAQYLYNEIHEAAEAGLTIFYLFGHDHSDDHDSYLGGGSIFLTPEDSIWLCKPGKQSENPEEKDLNFYYMNAGYVGYSEDDADNTLTMTSFAITDSKIVVNRYDVNGKHNLKSAGKYNATHDDSGYGYPVYDKVVESPYVVAETVPQTDNGVTVTAPGVTGVTVTVNENPTYDTSVYTAYASYNIVPTDYTQGTVATVTIPTPTSFDESKPAVVLYDGVQIALDTDLSDGITFTTNHFSEYDVAQVDESAGVTAGGYLAADATVNTTAVTDETLQPGYYLIQPVRDGNGTLTNVSTKVNNSTGLDVVDTGLNAQDNNVWYYDGTYIIHRSTGQYLSVGPGADAAALTDNATSSSVNSVYENTNYRGTYTLAATQNTTYKYLNRAGSGSFAGAWNSDGNGDEGSRWRFYEVTFNNADPVTLTVTPASKTVTTGKTATLNASVLVNNAAATSKTITWSSSNDTIATVDANGVVTGVKDGDVTITATLTKANGQNVNGTVKVEIPVKVKTRTAVSIAVDPMEGSVQRGAKNTAKTGSTMTVTYDDGSTETGVPVTLSMLTNKDGSAVSTSTIGTYDGLTVTYEGVTVSGYTLDVVAKAGNNHPDYPDEGAVKVTKHATGVDFQASGVAQVELAVSGVPVKKGADVIIMLDTSSSMTSHTVQDGSGKTRAKVLEESLTQLIAQFKAPGADGEPLDIKVAIANFDRFYTDANSPYHWDDTDKLTQWGNYGGGTNPNQVYTGSKAINADAFVDAQSLANSYTLTYQGGTNYDYAFDVIYQLGNAIQVRNATAGEDRDLYVLFLSDGAPYQYNYYQSSAQNMWNNWLQGTITDSMYANDANKNYYNLIDGVHKHRMAEAIKGSPDERYTIIRKNLTGFDTVDAIQTDYDNNMYTVPGLGATMYSIAFCPADDGDTKKASMEEVISNIASAQTGTTQYYYNVNSAAELQNAFTSIGSDIAYAASNARFVDQMGDQYSIKLDTSEYKIVNDNGTPDNKDDDTVIETKTVTPTIEILTYDIYTRGDYVKGDCTLAQIGDRKTNADGSYISTALETVTFNEAGTEAYSNLNSVGPDGTTITAGSNILIDGVIYANTFWYNTTANAVEIAGVDIPVKSNGGVTSSSSSNVLPAETFYWKVGTVQTKELAIRYYVYLDGSMEGERKEGSYNTNNYATLYYDNYLGNSCYKDAPVPVLAWKAARVSYGFYLVNSQGEPVNINGEKVSFSDRVIIVDRTPYEEVLLNSGDTVNSMKIIAGDEKVLPDGYNLYDEAAQYTVEVKSSGEGSWVIIKGTDKVATTYVTDFSGTVQYSNKLTEDAVGYDYTHTVVWFAIQWEPKPMPDTVVIDYGLPVDIHVMTNDMFGKYGTLVGVAAGDLTDSSSETNAITATEATGSFGTAKITSVESGVIRYTLNNGSDLEMNGADVFTYSVVYHNEAYSQNNGNYYQTVTVIPATTIYYEDSFLTLESYTVSGTESTKDETSAWTQVGSTVAGATQAEDRPGSINYGFGTVIDANNVYGYDGAYTACSEYSLGSAAKVHVGANSYATATFTFYGTGFDVISMTSNQTGVLWVKVYHALDSGDYSNAVPVKSAVVDTYYGYSQDANGKWVVTPNDPNALYQVPVMQIEELTYGKYYVEITASYVSPLDHTSEEGYDLYLDAIRIYDPAGTTYDVKDADGNVTSEGNIQDVIQDAYIADGEGWPAYEELRNNVIKAADYLVTENEDGSVTVSGTNLSGAIFIDSNDATNNIADYVSYGPNNELYLAPGQAIAFNVSTNAYVADVQLGIKVANGGSVTYAINGVEKTVSSATDMYYSILSYAKAGTVVIKNVSGGILSLTNIKVTYTQAPQTNEDPTDPASAPNTTSLLWMDGPSAGYALMSLRTPAVEDEVPEVTEPEVTEPEVTEPEVTEPEVTEPEVTEPEVTEPEVTEPEVTEPEETEPKETEPEETEPEETEPEETEPEVTEPEDPTDDPGTNLGTIIERVKKAIDWLIGWLRP